MTEEKYNGYTNYETWNVKLHMDNEQSSVDYWNEIAEEILEDSEADEHNTKEENATYNLRGRLKDYFEDEVQTVLESAKVECSYIADLLNSSVHSVNWYEIAECIIKDLVAEHNYEKGELNVPKSKLS